jgi:predicted enzyme related to lactoylglutathione lyase
MATINLFVDDMAAAIRWYTEVLGVPPYFRRPEAGPPAYVEFRIGDYQHELGLIDSSYAPHPRTDGAAGVVSYWHVDNLAESYDRLLTMGATKHEDLRERGAGFVTASVVDPFGNIVGIMSNPHYLEVLADRPG